VRGASLLLKRASLNIAEALDCSLKGNASVAGGQRSAAPGAWGEFASQTREYEYFRSIGLFPEGERVNSWGPAQPPVRGF